MPIRTTVGVGEALDSMPAGLHDHAHCSYDHTDVDHTLQRPRHDSPRCLQADATARAPDTTRCHVDTLQPVVVASPRPRAQHWLLSLPLSLALLASRGKRSVTPPTSRRTTQPTLTLNADRLTADQQ